MKALVDKYARKLVTAGLAEPGLGHGARFGRLVPASEEILGAQAQVGGKGKLVVHLVLLAALLQSSGSPSQVG